MEGYWGNWRNGSAQASPEEPGSVLSATGSSHSVLIQSRGFDATAGLYGHQACIWYTGMHADKTSLHSLVLKRDIQETLLIVVDSKMKDYLDYLEFKIW